MGVVYVECKKKCKCDCCFHFYACYREEDDNSFVSPQMRKDRSSSCGCGFYDDDEDYY